jgi:hypothetical protein
MNGSIVKLKPKLKLAHSSVDADKGSRLISYIYIKNHNDLSKDHQGIHEKEYNYLKNQGLVNMICALMSICNKKIHMRLVEIMDVLPNPDKQKQYCDVTEDHTISFSYALKVKTIPIEQGVENQMIDKLRESLYHDNRFVGKIGLGIIPETKTINLQMVADIYLHDLKLRQDIKQIYEHYIDKFRGKSKDNRLTIYEQAFGFTEITRVGAKTFANYLGYFMEDIYNLSDKFNKLTAGVYDGECDKSCYEAKNRHDTMKQSQALSEISGKIDQAVSKGKEYFYLLILIDKNNVSTNKPLHLGSGLSQIKNHKHYNPDKHRWVSGDEVYKLLFGCYCDTVKNTILHLLKINGLKNP